MPDIKLQIEASMWGGVLAYYALSDVTDSTGGPLLTNHATVTFGAGKVSNAATFVSASSQYLSLADNSTFQRSTKDFSVTCWLNFSTAATQKAVFYGSTGAQAGYGIQVNGGKIMCQISDGLFTKTTPGQRLYNDSVWHFVAMTCYRIGNEICYVDNLVEGQIAISQVGTVNNSGGFQIGAGLAANFLDGSVDEVGLWNRALTPAEVNYLWNNGAGRAYLG